MKRGGKGGRHFPRRRLSFRSREQNKPVAWRPTTWSTHPTYCPSWSAHAVRASVTPQPFCLCSLRQDSSSAAVAAGHRKYVSSNLSS